MILSGFASYYIFDKKIHKLLCKQIIHYFNEYHTNKTHIHTIDVSDRKDITDDISMYISKYKVHTLNLYNTNITDVSMLGNVHTLNLYNTNITNLSYTNITDVSMLGNVHTLKLEGCINVRQCQYS